MTVQFIMLKWFALDSEKIPFLMKMIVLIGISQCSRFPNLDEIGRLQSSKQMQQGKKKSNLACLLNTFKMINLNTKRGEQHMEECIRPR